MPKLAFPVSFVGKRSFGFLQPIHFWNLDDSGTWADSAGGWSGFSYGTSNGDSPVISVDAGVGPGGQAMARWDNYTSSEDHEYLVRYSGNTWDGANGNDMTASCWVNPTTYGAFNVRGSYGNHFIEWSNTGNNLCRKSIYLDRDGGGNLKLRAWVEDDSGNNVRYTNGPTVPRSTWTHLAFTVSGQTVKVYMNGILQFTGSNGSLGNIHSIHTRFNIGTSMRGAYQPQYHRYSFNDSNPAYVGMVGVWDVALDVDQINHLFNGGLGRNFQNL